VKRILNELPAVALILLFWFAFWSLYWSAR
jgi:hypothetical protein